ncbi:hypothetical protein FKW77_000661 [Venturia effusa]|uniref:Uncharacterized protein n=1 Tax=Venturia effusa TaxID=50376 RepID=A0A517L4P9_9PEZI|nr:hypothetical protein FKW77_000661 [Venturia effusa]
MSPYEQAMSSDRRTGPEFGPRLGHFTYAKHLNVQHKKRAAITRVSSSRTLEAGGIEIPILSREDGVYSQAGKVAWEGLAMVHHMPLASPAG